MSCQDLESVLVELARQQPVDAGLRTRALVHVEICARCAARFSAEQALSAELRALAAGAEAAQAPPHVEAALRAAFRARRQASGAGLKPRPALWPWWRQVWAIATSLVVLFAAAAALLRHAPAPELPQPAAGQEVATGFISLVYENDPLPTQNAQILRVKLPRIALVSFGLPVSEDRAGESVKADVLVGDDGVARAIRLVTQF